MHFVYGHEEHMALHLPRCFHEMLKAYSSGPDVLFLNTLEINKHPQDQFSKLCESVLTMSRDHNEMLRFCFQYHPLRFTFYSHNFLFYVYF